MLGSLCRQHREEHALWKLHHATRPCLFNSLLSNARRYDAERGISTTRETVQQATSSAQVLTYNPERAPTAAIRDVVRTTIGIEDLLAGLRAAWPSLSIEAVTTEPLSSMKVRRCALRYLYYLGVAD